jgi:hypothetical protein
VTTALVVGVGAVGTRAARQLVDTAAVDRVLLADERRPHVEAVAKALGEKAEVVDHEPGDAIPTHVDVVACALPTGFDHAVAVAAIAAGVPFVTSDDDHDAIEALRALQPNAVGANVTLAVGCGISPGFADVLVRHAAAMFSSVDEIRVARTGWAGPASVASVRRERRAQVRSWREGTWREEHPHGEALVWFPDPIGGHDCQLVTGGAALLVDEFPKVPRISVLLGEPPKRAWLRRRFGDDGLWGAARVEVWGRRDDTYDCVVYGLVERTEVAAGTVLAVTAGLLGGAFGDRIERPGVHGLAALAEPVPFLAEVAQRGVRAAVFEGAPVI